jgi:hypothetical protein
VFACDEQLGIGQRKPGEFARVWMGRPDALDRIGPVRIAGFEQVLRRFLVLLQITVAQTAP